MKFAHAVFVATALAASTAYAAVERHDAGAKLPAEMVQGQVRYVTGGIGRDEASAFKRAERHYPLALEFANRAKPHDEFTADVKVVIRDARGKVVLDAISSGPFLLARLPVGDYDIEATQKGRMLDRHAVVVDRKPIHVGFLWRKAGV